MPALFAEMCEELVGARPEVTMLAFSNRTLEWYRKEYFSVRFALLYGHYDACVIQQYGHPFPGIEQTDPYVEQLKELCRSVRTMPVLLMTWAKKDAPETSDQIAAAYRLLAQKHKMQLAPVGELFQEIRKTHPEIDLYRHDGSHASAYGSYLVASTLAALLIKPKDLSRLSDRSYDFHARFAAGIFPLAEEDLSGIPVALKPEYAAILRNIVEDRILKQNDNI